MNNINPIFAKILSNQFKGVHDERITSNAISNNNRGGNVELYKNQNNNFKKQGEKKCQQK
jgi:hypothetical protein